MASLSVRTRRRLIVLVTSALAASGALTADPALAQTAAPSAPAAAQGSASVKIGTSDGKGLIYVDGKLVGEGSFVGDLPAGTHKVRIEREGYEPFDEDLVVKDKEPLARSVTLKLSSRVSTEQALPEAERLEGVYGGFGLLGLFTPGGTHSSLQRQCETRNDPQSPIPNLVSCEAPDGAGGGLGGFVGYHWDPVGMELYLAGTYDQRALTNDWNAANTDPGLGPDPARLEEFTLRRVGGVALARIRLSWQIERVRLGFVAGAGLSYRVMSLDRLTKLKEDPRLKDVLVADTVSYVSPVIAFEPTVMLRLTKGTAISLGFQLLLETPSSFLNGDETPKTQREATHSLGPTRSLTTPSYELASKTQIFMGPVLGMMFGP